MWLAYLVGNQLTELFKSNIACCSLVAAKHLRVQNICSDSVYGRMPDENSCMLEDVARLSKLVCI